MNQGTFTTSMGVIRTGVGLALVAAPAKAGHLWIGEHATGGETDTPDAGVAERAGMVGQQDAVLGSTTPST